MSDLQARRLMLIKDTLGGGMNSYSLNQVAIYPLIDGLHLLIQTPLSISFFTEPRPNGLIYTSLVDPELYDQFMKSVQDCRELGEKAVKVPLRTNLFVCLHSIDTSPGIKNAIFRPFKPEIFQDLITKNLIEDDEGRLVLKGIETGLQTYKRYASTRSILPSSLEERKNDLSGVDIPSWLDSLLNPMRRILDDAWDDVMDSPRLRPPPEASHTKEWPTFNLFCVIRTATNLRLRRNRFNYEARLLLSDTQKEQIRQWADCRAKSLEYNDSEELCKHLEFPLGNKARSIADSVFASGVIDFSAETAGEGRDDAGEQARSKDKLRQKAEGCIYSQIAQPAHTFYIPIHIGGVPWLALFTLKPQDISWEHNYRVYRDLIPKIAERLRTGVKSAYLNLIRETLATELDGSDNTTLLDHVNKSWKRLTYIYPYDGVQLLETQQDNAQSLVLPDGRQVWLSLYENPSYIRQVPYNRLDPASCLKACQDAVTQVRLQRIELDRRLRAQLLSQRHTIFNRIPLNELQNALSCNENDLSGEARIWVEDAKRATEILNVSLWIAFKERGEWLPLHDVQSVIGLLHWLKERTLSCEAQPCLSIPDNSLDLDVVLKANELPDAFTVLWNLWHNASKIYPSFTPSHFQITASQRDDNLAVTFVNEGIMSEYWVNYLLDKGPSPSDRDELTGLEIVKQQMPHLGWWIEEVKVENKYTHITIAIPTRLK